MDPDQEDPAAAQAVRDMADREVRGRDGLVGLVQEAQEDLLVHALAVRDRVPQEVQDPGECLAVPEESFLEDREVRRRHRLIGEDLADAWAV